MKEKKLKILICGGGTAGHIYPALATINALKKNSKNIEILYIGSKKGLEKKIIPRLGIKFKTIPTGKLRRFLDFSSIVKNFFDLFKIPLGFLKSFFIIRKFSPDLIFSKGGYVAFPPTLAGFFLKIPIIIHESDLEMGLSNKLLSKIAKKVAVSFPEKYYPYIKKEKIIFVGNPLREEIFKKKRKEVLRKFNFSENKKTIMIIGGSQGARKINYTILKILNQLLRKYQVIHICGRLDFQDLKEKTKNFSKSLLKNYRLFDFLEDIGLGYIAADLFISRAGMNVLSEIVFLSKPAIFIPLKGHQEANANFLKNKEIYKIIKNEELTAEKLLSSIEKLFQNYSSPKKRFKATQEIFPKNASFLLAKEIIKFKK